MGWKIRREYSVRRSIYSNPELPREKINRYVKLIPLLVILLSSRGSPRGSEPLPTPPPQCAQLGNMATLFHLIKVAILLGREVSIGLGNPISDDRGQLSSPPLSRNEHVDGGGGGRGVLPGAIEGKKALDGELIRAGER